MSKNGIEETILTGGKQIIKNVKDVKKEVDKTDSSVNKLSKSIAKLFSAKKISAFITQGINKTVDYIEDLNLLKVAFGDTSDAAYDLSKNIARITGFDEATLVRNLATFRNLTSTLSLTNEQADLLATNLEKMSLDISSLYNVDLDRAAYALQGMLTGQPRSIKSITGANVTNASLQEELTARGINMKVSELNKAQKAVLQYVVVEKQLINSNGDLARTLEQPANLLKVFNDQVSKAARSLGTLFLPVIQAVIPYLTAFLMVFNEIANAIAKLFGIDADKFWNDMTVGSSNVSSNLESIGKAANKANKGLRAFDRLNTISTPSKTSTGLGGMNLGSDFEKMLKEYNLKLEGIQTKAAKIRDSIMEWLGFAKDSNGEFKFVGITLGTIIGALIGGGGLLFAVSKIFKMFSGIKSIFGLGDKLSGKSSKSSFTVPDVKTVLKGLADLALIVGGVVLLVEAIGLFMKIPKAKETLTDGISALVETFAGLAKIILPLAAFSAGIVGLGAVSPVTVLSGMAGLAIIIGGLELVLLAVGAISKLPYVQEFIDTGVDILIKLFDGIGKIAGAIVAGFVDMATSSLGEVGTHLSEFMTNLTPFIEGLDNLSKEKVEAANLLASMILTLTKAEILDGLFGWVTGGNSLVKFGKDLADFAPYFKKYSNAITGIKPDTITASASAAKSLAEFAKSLPKEGGLWGKISGNRDLEKFSSLLPNLGKNLKAYSDNVTGIKNDVVESSAKSAMALAELAKYLPREGGLWGLIAGDRDLEKFSKVLPEFGKNLKAYSDNVKGIDNEVVQNSSKAAQSVVELAKMIPNEGGLAALFAGDNSIKKFGEELKSFGQSFNNYYKSISNLGVDKINTVTDSIQKLVNAAVTIKNQGVKSTLKDFANELGKSTSGIEKFFSITNAKTIGNDFGTQIGNSIVAALKKIQYPKINLIGNDNSTIGSYKIQAKAEGGFVDSGELYLARENGMSEYIGQMGHKTAVANNDQIVAGISQGVKNAIIETGGLSSRPVVIKADGDTNGLMNFIKFKQQEDNMQYGN